MITIVWRKLDNTEVLEFGDFAANYDLNMSYEQVKNAKMNANYDLRLYPVCVDIGDTAQIYDDQATRFHTYRPVAIITPYEQPVIEPLKERRIDLDL